MVKTRFRATGQDTNNIRKKKTPKREKLGYTLQQIMPQNSIMKSHSIFYLNMIQMMHQGDQLAFLIGWVQGSLEIGMIDILICLEIGNMGNLSLECKTSLFMAMSTLHLEVGEAIESSEQDNE